MCQNWHVFCRMSCWPQSTKKKKKLGSRPPHPPWHDTSKLRHHLSWQSSCQKVSSTREMGLADLSSCLIKYWKIDAQMRSVASVVCTLWRYRVRTMRNRSNQNLVRWSMRCFFDAGDCKTAIENSRKLGVCFELLSRCGISSCFFLASGCCLTYFGCVPFMHV